MPEDRGILVGIDIGGTSVKCLAYDSSAGIFSPLHKMPMEKCVTAKEEVDRNIIHLIRQMLRIEGLADRRLEGIGVSSAALFDAKTGDLVRWPNNPLWNGFPLQSYLSAAFHTNVVMEDDANACTIAEWKYGAGRGCTDMAYLTISSGIGCGLVLDNGLYKGVHGWAGELGHVRIPFADELCTCGRKGCLQAVGSGWALYKKAVQVNNAQPIPLVINDLEEVVALAKTEVPWAVELFQDAGSAIARAIENLVLLLDIETFVLGGGVMNAEEIVLQPIAEHLDRLLAGIGRTANVKTGLLGDKGGAIGGVCLFNRPIEQLFNEKETSCHQWAESELPG